jgi:hypothetical protein
MPNWQSSNDLERRDWKNFIKHVEARCCTDGVDPDANDIFTGAQAELLISLAEELRGAIVD